MATLKPTTFCFSDAKNTSFRFRKQEKLAGRWGQVGFKPTGYLANPSEVTDFNACAPSTRFFAGNLLPALVRLYVPPLYT